MQRVIALWAAVLIGVTGAPALTKTTTHRKSSTSKPAGKPGPRKKSARRAPKATWRAGQMTPTPDRYKEIQEALARKGYLKAQATGDWTADSADALRRFQHDQNLEPSGKLDSLSLVALGLGPKYGPTPEKKSQSFPDLPF